MSAHSAVLERGFRYSMVWVSGWAAGLGFERGVFFLCLFVCLALPCLIGPWCVVVLDGWLVGWGYHGEIVICSGTWGENKCLKPVADGWAGNSRLSTGIGL